MLPNRQIFQDRLVQAINSARRIGNVDQVERKIAVMMLDLDNFKKVNDCNGDAHGDLVPQAVSTRRSACIRESDTLACMRGDELTFILEGIAGSTETEDPAERGQKRLSDPVTISNHDSLMTASIGIYMFPQDGKDTETLLKKADAAMHMAERDGRGYCFSQIREGAP